MGDLLVAWESSTTRSEDGQAGDRHIGPDPASEGEDPLAGPLAVAIHEVESGEKDPRANSLTRRP